MATKTIGIKEEVYERLVARKGPDESFTDLLDRLVEDTEPDWREGFGTLPEEDANSLREATREARERVGSSVANRHERAIEEMDRERSRE